jgi:hypothetical protein
VDRPGGDTVTLLVPPVQSVSPLLMPVDSTLEELADCVCEQIGTIGGGPVCWCGLYPGAQVSFEYCTGECEPDRCGMAWVRVVGIAPFEAFGTPTIDTNCALPLGWQIEVGALRCLPVYENLPTPEEMMEVTVRQHADALALYTAIQCCQLSTQGAFAIVQYVPVGPEGGCVGGYWNAFAAID